MRRIVFYTGISLITISAIGLLREVHFIQATPDGIPHDSWRPMMSMLISMLGITAIFFSDLLLKRRVSYAGIALILMGAIGVFYAGQYTHLTPDGVLHDSLWLPVGSLSVLLGIFSLLISGIFYLTNSARNLPRYRN